MRIRILLFTLILIVLGHPMHAGQTPPPGDGRKVYILLQDGTTMELPFTGFHAVCAGYGEGGVKYSTPAGPISILWKDVEYILPQWEEGRLVNGTGLYTEVLRPALCPGAYISQVKQRVVKVKNRKKVQEETVKFPLSGIHVIAFDKAGLENGRQKLVQKPVLLDPETGIEFVLVKGGCFDMGDTGEDADGLKQVHTVCQDDFYLGKYEVTQAQWRAVMGKNPSAFGACGDNCPVENVSWHDVQDFIRTLKQHAGKAYRLPTEAEWEYAARAGGKKQKYAGTNSDEEIGEYAWYGENAGGRSHPVGQKNPNGLGLYDMSGNVFEWLSDRYDADYYRVSPRNNPPGPSEGDHRVNRGGGWSSLPKKVRLDFRDHDNPTRKSNNLGFRLALPAKQP